MMQYFENLTYDTHINISYTESPKYFPPHWHSDIESIAPLQEGVSVAVDARRFELLERDCVIIYPGEIHEIASQTQRKSIVIQFAPTLLTLLSDFRQNFRLLSQVHHLSDDKTPSLMRELAVLLRYILETRQKDVLFGEAEIYARLLSFFAVFGRFCVENALDGGAVHKKIYTEKLADVCSYITEHCTQPISLEAVAARFGFSKFYFSRLFKRCTNVSFWSFVTQARVRQAEQLMADPDAPVTDVALRAGFGSIAAFNRAFKESRGITPKEYRKLYLKNERLLSKEQ
jgi:AraC-like DNA-binding protein